MVIVEIFQAFFVEHLVEFRAFLRRHFSNAFHQVVDIATDGMQSELLLPNVDVEIVMAVTVRGMMVVGGRRGFGGHRRA